MPPLSSLLLGILNLYCHKNKKLSNVTSLKINAGLQQQAVAKVEEGYDMALISLEATACPWRPARAIEKFHNDAMMTPCDHL